VVEQQVKAKNSIVVSEVFGPTFQGEGPNAGQRVAFIRTGGCNLHCSWCDTPYTWDAKRFDLRDELSRLPVDAIVNKVRSMEVHRVVISGGEPLLWQAKKGWRDMLAELSLAGLKIEVETNGTIAPDGWTVQLVDQFNVSPKLAHAGDPEHARIVPDVLRTFAALARSGIAALKVVVVTPGDVAQAADLAARFGFPKRAVWVMPEGMSVVAIVAGHKYIAQAALDAGVNMTTRLHVLTWGEERGR
jgi:7-cyano-7-deazaguanosine (preQ0) biosynthesis protein QueE